MSRFLLGLVLVLGGLLAWGRLREALQSVEPQVPVAEASAPASAEIPPPARAGGTTPALLPPPRPVQVPDTPGDPLVRLAIRQRIHREGPVTYLDSLFAGSDSVLRRWPDRNGAPLTVAETGGGLDGLTDRHRRMLREALARWEELRLGIRFVFVADTLGSDLLVHWIERFPMDRSGQADVQWVADGRIFHARLTLALRTYEGVPLPDHAFAAVATHEVGHAIGLPHSGDPQDVMYPTTRTAQLSARDRSTARLLYSLPVGSIRP